MFLTSHSSEEPETAGTDLRKGHAVLAMCLIALAVIALDQLTKTAVVQWIGPEEWPHRRELAGRFVAFHYVENTGAAFGIFAGRVWLLSALALAVASGFVAVYWNDLHSSWLLRLSLGMVLGGAIGNLLDRIRLGHVIDFLAVGTFPRFNIADSAITIGLILLFVAAMRDDTQSEKTP